MFAMKLKMAVDVGSGYRSQLAGVPSASTQLNKEVKWWLTRIKSISFMAKMRRKCRLKIVH